MSQNNNQYQQYWIGPADVLIPHYIECVPAGDNKNNMHRDGFYSKRWGVNIVPYNVKSYRENFAELKNDGHYYWKEDSKINKNKIIE